MKVEENSEVEKGIRTKVVNYLDGISEDPQFEPETHPDITDAALLMAADGYGQGKIKGESDGKEIIIRTNETQKSFLFNKEPLSDDLAKEADEFFHKINQERDMGH